jgi:hypothetical protein
VTLLERLPRTAEGMDDECPPPRRFDQLRLDFTQLLDGVFDLDRMADQLPREYQRRHDGGPSSGAVVTVLGSRHGSGVVDQVREQVVTENRGQHAGSSRLLA